MVTFSAICIMFSFPTLNDVWIFDGDNRLSCQAEFNLRDVPLPY